MPKLLLATASWTGAVLVFALLAALAGPGATADAGPPVDLRMAAPVIREALGAVGTVGWYRMCDRLACHAYGHANSGYPTAAAHWQAMLATGHAHRVDRCAPAGSFAFWATPSGAGHVALVVAADPTCNPDDIWLVSNDVLDAEVGQHGGAYLVSLTRLETGFVNHVDYLGWSEPICPGGLLDGAVA
ncbi:MAG TPA: hypothetical protein VHV82_08280 [Sporichthyaceae bacterium]|nr:hypothetical protein [Sporichthyaceae bacterium]